MEERVFPANQALFAQRPWSESAHLAPRFDGAILGASALRAEDERDPWSTPSSRRRRASGTTSQRGCAAPSTRRRSATGSARSTPSRVDDDAFVLAVPNDFTREWIEGHFVELIRAAMKDATGAERRLRLTVAGPAAGAAGAADARLGRRRAGRLRRPAARRRHQAEVHVRLVRDRLVQPLRARGRARRRRGAGAGVQPALHLRAHRPGQDAPAARGRELRRLALDAHVRALRQLGDLRQRLHQLAARQADRGLQAALPHLRRAADRRHPVPRAQGADPGGVLPHLQLAPRGRPADRHELRPAAARVRRRSRTGCARGSSGG